MSKLSKYQFTLLSVGIIRHHIRYAQMTTGVSFGGKSKPDMKESDDRMLALEKHVAALKKSTGKSVLSIQEVFGLI